MQYDKSLTINKGNENLLIVLLFVWLEILLWYPTCIQMVKYDEKKIPFRIATFSQEINRLIYVTCINKNVGNLKENLRKFPKPKQAAGMSST